MVCIILISLTLSNRVTAKWEHGPEVCIIHISPTLSNGVTAQVGARSPDLYHSYQPDTLKRGYGQVGARQHLDRARLWSFFSGSRHSVSYSTEETLMFSDMNPVWFSGDANNQTKYIYIYIIVSLTILNIESDL